VASISEFASLLLLNNLGLNTIPASPIALVFSVLYQFSRVVPSIYHFRIFGIVFNNKSFTYLLAAQVRVAWGFHQTLRFYSAQFTRIHYFPPLFVSSKLAFSTAPGSFASALIGVIAGQLYRADFVNLKTYQLPPWLIRLSSRISPYVVGSTRPPRRTNRALHEGSRASSASISRAGASGVTDEDEGPITTARRNPSSATRPPAVGRMDNLRSGTTTSVMRDWVNELTGRDGSSPGLRIPSEAEISQVSAMFPNVSRETVVGALQGRCVR